MKKSIKLFLLLIPVFIANISSAQTITEGKTSVYFQLGVSGGFNKSFSGSVFIPQLGIDANLGLFGIRGLGQFFNTDPQFDINSYLKPISSVITTSNIQEKNSNVLLGLSPYFNFETNNISIQPGVGLKYLLHKGATATAKYNKEPYTVILKFPEKEANRNLFIIEPNIRAVFGKPGSFFRFFVEAGYTVPLGDNEYSFTSRVLDGVVDQKGNIDTRALLSSKEVIKKETSMPSFVNFGVGLQIKLFSNYGIEKPTDTDKEYFTQEPQTQNVIKNEPESYEVRELKPLMLITKGVKKPIKKENPVEFYWIALNSEECGALQYEFTITEIPDETKMNLMNDITYPLKSESIIYRKVLDENNLKTKGSTFLTHKINRNDLPILFESDKQFIWTVKALDMNGQFPECAWGGNNTISSVYKSYGCGIEVLIDTVLCSKSTAPSGYMNYDVKFRIRNNSDQECTNTNAVFTGNTVYPFQSNIKFTNTNGQPINGISYSPQNPLNGLTLPMGQTSNLYSVTITLPTNTGINSIRLHALPTYNNIDPAYGAAYDDKNLPPCGCNFCDNITINIIQPSKPAIVSTSQNGYDEIAFPLIINYPNLPVNRVIAEVVAFQHTVNNASCITCNTDNRMHGVFVDPTQNYISGNASSWANSGNAFLYSGLEYSREATWKTLSTAGTYLNNQLFMFKLGVPTLNTLICCQDRIRWTIRFSFISENPNTGECRVCEKTRSFCLIRTGGKNPNKLNCKEPIPIPPDIMD